MNRILWIPATCALLAFTLLLAAFHAAAGREAVAEPAEAGRTTGREIAGKSPQAVRYTATATYDAKPVLPLSVDDAEQLLASLTEEYLRPRREWATSPRRFYSRAAPRPLPTIEEKIEIAKDADAQPHSVVVAQISISIGPQTESYPCVVDRFTKQVRLFDDGRWITDAEWLETAMQR